MRMGRGQPQEAEGGQEDRLEGLGRPVKAAVLVDLARGPAAGGHVKCWERLAAASTGLEEVLDLTVFFSAPSTPKQALESAFRPSKAEVRSSILGGAKIEELPRLLPTSLFSALTGPIPDHTDLSPFHPLLAHRLRAGGFDVVHTTDAYFAFAACARRHARKCFSALTDSLHTDTPNLARMFAEKAIRRLAGGGAFGDLLDLRLRLPDRAMESKKAALAAHHARCSFVLGSTSQDLADLSARLGKGKVRRLRRGIDREAFHPSRRDRAWLKSAYGIEEDDLAIVCVGRLDPSKSPLLLARACAKAKSPRRIRVVFAGEGVERAALSEFGGAVLAGQLDPDALGRLVASCDVLAAPSNIEILGNVVLEGFASGLPCLVSDCPGLSAEVEDKKTGLVLPGGSEKAWIQAIESLAQNQDRLFELRSAVAASKASPPSWRDVLFEDLLPVWTAAAVGREAGSGAGRGADREADRRPARETDRGKGDRG